jgi:hypothetical protein
MIWSIFFLLILSCNLFAFEGVITFSQDDVKNGKIAKPITKKISAFFKDDSLVRLTIEYDILQLDRASDDMFISLEKNEVSILTLPQKSYKVLAFDKKEKAPDTEMISLGAGEKVLNYSTNIVTFPDNHSPVKTYLYYSDDFKVKPQPYLLSTIGSFGWAIHPKTGAIALKTYLKLSKDSRRTVKAIKIEKRVLKTSEYNPDLTSFKKSI